MEGKADRTHSDGTLFPEDEIVKGEDLATGTEETNRGEVADKIADGEGRRQQSVRHDHCRVGR